MTSLPDFLVVGAAKSGTTSLYKILLNDPRVFIPKIKECRFFSQMPRNFKGGAAARFQNEGPRELTEYLDLFRNKENYLKGDISNDYFYYYKKSIINIQEIYRKQGQEEPKIVIVLRNPVDRVFSMYNHTIRLASDSVNFDRAFQLSKERVRDGYAWMFDLMGVGESADAVESYISAFPNVKIFLFEEVFSSAGLADLCNFLGIELNQTDIININENANYYTMPKSMLLAQALSQIIHLSTYTRCFLKNKYIRGLKRSAVHRLSILNKGKPVHLLERQRRYLSTYYEYDISRLEILLKRDLSSWLR